MNWNRIVNGIYRAWAALRDRLPWNRPGRTATVDKVLIVYGAVAGAGEATGTIRLAVAEVQPSGSCRPSSAPFEVEVPAGVAAGVAGLLARLTGG